MQPWKISAGLTAAIAGSAILLAGPRLEYLAPYWPLLLAEHGVLIALHLALALATIALESCAAELEATLRERDETTLSLTEAATESGYSTDHLGRLVREGKIPNAGRPGAPRIARSILPRKTQAPATPLLVEKHRRGEVSNAQIVQSIIERGIE